MRLAGASSEADPPLSFFACAFEVLGDVWFPDPDFAVAIEPLTAPVADGSRCESSTRPARERGP